MDHEPGGQIIQLQQTSQTLIGKYRRNRKLQSCEPCRKSKLACDHSVPCGRCIRRQCVDKCFYHPNPLTRNRQAVPRAIPTPSDSTSSPAHSSRRVVQSIESPPNPRLGNVLRFPCKEAPVIHRASSAPPLHQSHEAIQSDKQSFLGSTSVTSMLTEDLEKLGVSSVDLQTFSAQSVAISYDRITKGCEVLAFLKNSHMVNQFVGCFYDTWEGNIAYCIEPIMKMWLLDLWQFHEQVLKSQNPDKIRQLCELIWRNTQSPLIYNGKTSPKQWISLSSGPNIRWEVIGLIACSIAQATVAGDSSRRLLEEYQTTREAVTSSMVDIAATCLTFCRECEVLDDTFLWLVAEYYGLIGFVKGDVSYSVYRAGAELSSTLLAMGLHQDIRANTRVPPFLAQLRKQVRMVIYSSEISVSAFLGRPPRLSYRYLNLDTGYDFTNAEILTEESEFAANVSKLLEGGFNADGHIRPITFWKLWIPFAILREQILELALGNLPADEVLRRADEIQQKAEEQWANMPSIYTKWREGELPVDAKKYGVTLYGHIFRQSMQANEFLLQRVRFQKAGASVEGLIKVAQRMFKDIIRISEDPELTSISTDHTNQMVALHGLRCAAVLAVELLRQEQLPVYPKEPLLPRSQTIQDLSVFVSRLDLILKVELLQGMFAVCEQGRKVLTRILDKILSPPNAADRPCQSCQSCHTCHTSHQHAGHQQPELETFQGGMVSNDGGDYLGHASFMGMDDFNFAIDAPYLGPDYDFRQWLENMDWSQTLA